MTTTSGSAKWQGGIKDGKGAISTKSGALKDYPYGFASRFEGKPGSNPEELIGAAHAACFTMALSLILGEAKLTAEQMETKADVTLEKVGDGFAITSVHLTLDRERSPAPTTRNSRNWPAWPRPDVRCRSCSTPRSRWTRQLRREARIRAGSDSGFALAPRNDDAPHISASPSGPTEAMRSMLVVPGARSGTPATMMTRWPARAKPSRKAMLSRRG